ncbi:uncharacterized protein LOC119770551 [Culex quinquefasciatus]|uniref:uncharacterized protein LOC119770551 n=1 Tax=Culex quinquefasciatus TaxID=7176 RepID=UPI0018E2C418|nr:uncharacterized protein LOC119770551 [Culex quinquefasciatus]XP_039452619.1 uncharacterized protein LOC120431574 [Culex pipiens pallens]
MRGQQRQLTINQLAATFPKPMFQSLGFRWHCTAVEVNEFPLKLCLTQATSPCPVSAIGLLIHPSVQLSRSSTRDLIPTLPASCIQCLVRAAPLSPVQAFGMLPLAMGHWCG